MPTTTRLRTLRTTSASAVVDDRAILFAVGRPKRGLFGDHEGVLLYQQHLSLANVVVELQEKGGLNIVPYEDFDRNEGAWFTMRLDGNEARVALDRLVRIVGEGRTWGNGYFCDSFVVEVMTGDVATSPQLRDFGKKTLLALAIAAILGGFNEE